MSTDLLSNAIPGNRKVYNFTTFSSLLTLALGPPDAGVANTKGLMKLPLPANYTITITSQSNAARWQLVKIVDYSAQKVTLFGGDGEGVPMRITGGGGGGARDILQPEQRELNLGRSATYREIGVQFGVHDDDSSIRVPIINNAVLKRVGRDLEWTIVTEDAGLEGDADFNDSSVTIRMRA